MKILTIVGARPQFVKAAVVSRAIEEYNARSKGEPIEELIVHTGQHFDDNMSSVFFEQMNIPKPHYNLEVNSLSHGAMTGKMLGKIEEILFKEKPIGYLCMVIQTPRSPERWQQKNSTLRLLM